MPDSQRRGPSMIDAVTEMPRLVAEAGLFSLSWPALLASAARGPSHPVVVVPGFLGGDDSTLILRRFLTRLGYHPQPWLLGQNRGHPKAIERLGRRFYRLFQVYGEPITLIGQSLGGVYARELAREFPDAVRSVITLGSPFGAHDPSETNPMVTRLFESMSGMSVEEMRAMAGDRDPTLALSMPSTAIYSKTDGVVSWRACMQQETPTAENIEIIGSHTGMAVHPAALMIVADRLTQPIGGWKKYRASCSMLGRRSTPRLKSV